MAFMPSAACSLCAEHGILPKRIGTLVHDCWGPYWQLDCEHALCNAHLLRELTFLHETTGQRWPKHMMGLLTRAHTLCEASRDRTTERRSVRGKYGGSLGTMRRSCSTLIAITLMPSNTTSAVVGSNKRRRSI